MKKQAILILVLLLCLTSCQSRLPEVSGESSAPSTSQAPTGNFEEPFSITDPAGKTLEELLEAQPYVVYYNDAHMETKLNTPPVLYLKVSGRETLLAYDKSTGNFSSACRDPLCDHETCLWGSGGSLLYRGENGLFFLQQEDDFNVIYAADFFGDNAEKLYQTTDALSHLVQEREYLYFLAESVEEETGSVVGTVCRLHLAAGETEEILSLKGLYYFMPLDGKLLYSAEDGMNLYDPATKETTLYGGGELLPVALFGEYFYYKKGQTLYRRGEKGLGEEELLYEDGIDEILFGKEHLYFCNAENVIYRATFDFSEVTVLHTPGTDSRISDVTVHGNLLYYTYRTGNGSSRKHYTVFVDLATGNTLQVMT